MGNVAPIMGYDRSKERSIKTKSILRSRFKGCCHKYKQTKPKNHVLHRKVIFLVMDLQELIWLGT